MCYHYLFGSSQGAPVIAFDGQVRWSRISAAIPGVRGCHSPRDPPVLGGVAPRSLPPA
ncbi:MAG TPA: hypothetical protein VMV49_13525 [Candidatus Deferrimicrobium sp.]|nr:hypothetical protein [Candidatus Deferrimicrobium sp.]